MIPTINELLVVRDKAVEALRGQRPGNGFVGAFREAELAGYVQDTVEFNVFVTIFVGAIDSVVIDGCGSIISIQMKAV